MCSETGASHSGLSSKMLRGSTCWGLWQDTSDGLYKVRLQILDKEAIVDSSPNAVGQVADSFPSREAARSVGGHDLRRGQEAINFQMQSLQRLRGP